MLLLNGIVSSIMLEGELNYAERIAEIEAW